MSDFIVRLKDRALILNDNGTWAHLEPRGSVLEKLKSLPQPPGVLRVFEGLFDRLGFKVLDTGEALSCLQTKQGVVFTAGIDEESVELTVEIFAFQIDRLAEEVLRGTVSELEQFRIARELVSAKPGKGRSILYNPLMSSFLLRWVIRGRKLIHVDLVSPQPDEEEDAFFTLIFVNRRWLVVPDLHGEPERSWRVTVKDALELQRRFHAAMKSASLLQWWKTARWYVRWRKRVEVPRLEPSR